MDQARHCPKCGAELPSDALEGLCPQCMAQVVFGEAQGQEGPGERAPDGPESDFEMERAGVMIGRYKLLEQIGEGGFGVVYMAEQVEPVQRRVALKIIKAGMDTKEVVARFEAERQALALMDHPNIAKVLDGGTTGGFAKSEIRNSKFEIHAGRPYFVMELVRGIPITEFCDQRHLDTNQRLGLFIQVCKAVQHAHQKGIIHRDLKPSNILVTLHDGEAVPKIIDFGVAKALGQRLTDKTLFTGFLHLVGTPAYMSPEQAELSGLDVDTRSDIYSLGVLLYELLTGVTPFDADTLRKAALDEVRRMIREIEPPKPSTRLRTLGERLTEVAKQRHIEAPKLIHLVRGDLDWIVMMCLEKDRRRRYETANGLAMDVQRHLKDEPVVARPPSRLYELQKTVRRHKFGFGAAAALILVLALGVAISSWEAVRLRRAELAAEAQAARNAEVARFLQMTLQADSFNARGDTTEAETRLRQGLELSRKLWGDDDPTVVAMMERLMRLLLSEQKLDEYEKVVPDLLTPALERHPRNSWLLLRRADYLARHGRWREAIADVHKAIDSSPDDPWLHFILAPLLVADGDLTGYRRHCQHSIARFGLNKEPPIPDLLVRMCLILPSAGVDLNTVRQLATIRTTAGSNHEYSCSSALSMGLAEYRLKHYQSAVDWEVAALNKEVKGRTDEHKRFQAYLVQAMALKRLKRASSAQDALDVGKQIARTQLPHFENGFLNDDAWYDWLISRALLKEAIELIGDNIDRASLSNLLSSLRVEGEVLEPETLLTMKRRIFGDRHREVELALADLAQSLLASDRLVDAEAIRRKQVRLEIELSGPDHPNVATCLLQLAAVLRNQGKTAEAAETLRGALAIRRKALGSEHPDVAYALRLLAEVLKDQGNLEGAESALREAVAIGRSMLGDRDNSLVSPLSHLTRILLAQRKYQEAEAVAREYLSIGAENRAVQVVGSRDTILIPFPFSQSSQSVKHIPPPILSSSNQFHAAASNQALFSLVPEPMVSRVSLRSVQKASATNSSSPSHPTSGDWWTFDACSLVGQSLLGQGKCTEAEPLLRAGYKGMKQREEEIPASVRHTRLKESLQRLVQLYETMNQPDKAAEWKQKMVELDESLTGKP